MELFRLSNQVSPKFARTNISGICLCHHRMWLNFVVLYVHCSYKQKKPGMFSIISNSSPKFIPVPDVCVFQTSLFPVLLYSVWQGLYTEWTVKIGD